MGKVAKRHKVARCIGVHHFEPSRSACEIHHVGIEFRCGQAHGLATRTGGGQVLHVVRAEEGEFQRRSVIKSHRASL